MQSPVVCDICAKVKQGDNYTCDVPRNVRRFVDGKYAVGLAVCDDCFEAHVTKYTPIETIVLVRNCLSCCPYLSEAVISNIAESTPIYYRSPDSPETSSYVKVRYVWPLR